MTKIFNKRAQTSTRKMLRRSMSRAEVILWKYLSRKQVLGYKFRRQYGVDKYVIDFYCPKLKLAVEVDGQSHIEARAIESDRARQSFIEALGIHFLRITNEEIYKDPSGVLERITSEIKALEGPDSDTKADGSKTSPKSPPYQGGDKGKPWT